MRTFMKTGLLFILLLRWPSRSGRQTHRVFVVSSERHHLGYLEIAGSNPARSIHFPASGRGKGFRPGRRRLCRDHGKQAHHHPGDPALSPLLHRLHDALAGRAPGVSHRKPFFPGEALVHPGDVHRAQEDRFLQSGENSGSVATGSELFRIILPCSRPSSGRCRITPAGSLAGRPLPCPL